MRAVLEFALPEEEAEFRAATEAGRLQSACWEFGEWLRSQVKYGELSEVESDVLERVRARLYAILDEHGVTLD